MIDLPGGRFAMGEDGPWAYPGDGEGRVDVDVASFSISRTAVTNAEFREFVDATGHRTTAEAEGWSFVFAGLLPDDFEPTRGVAGAEWWRQVYGAAWDRPEGPHSTVADRADHPVVHVSWTDAIAYAAWAGGRLPSEAEWEFAARGGASSTFAWGDELEPGGEHRMNVWQGEFPNHNTEADGHYGTCPVDEYLPNDFGLHNATGNVWEWTADVFTVDRLGGRVPPSPVDLTPRPAAPRVMKGGSYLCHASYCRRYRPAARIASAPDSSSGNVGFRVAV